MGAAIATAMVPHDGLSEVLGTHRLSPSSESIGDALIRLSIEASARPALMWASGRGAQKLTWSQLAEHARRGATTLTRINPGRRRVALVGYNSVDWIVAMFACALSGMSVVPVSASATREEIRHQLSHAEVAVVLAARSAGQHRPLDMMASLTDALVSPRAVRDIAGIGAVTPADGVGVSADDEFLVQYTSGTTGLPKAASLTHRAALNSAAVYAQACGARQGDGWLNPLPLHHVGGSVSGIVAVLAIGGWYPVIERFDPRAVLDVIRQTRPALVGLVPTMIIDLLAMTGVSPVDFCSVRTVIGGATAVDPGLIEEMEQRLRITFMVAYGQSEAPMMTASLPGDPPKVRTQTLGRCLAGRDFAVRDSSGTVVPIGMLGELCVRGPLTMTGYLRPGGGLDPAADDDGWRRTGDLCSMDATGVLTFRGRIREVVIRGGLNVYPAEVEQVIATHETVSEVAVFGVPDSRLGERVVAAVIPGAGAAIDLDELTTLSAKRLSAYKRPAEWIIASTFPRTSTGKVRKHLLREWYEDGTLEARCCGCQDLAP